jgi:hypothetical protein
MAQGATTLLGFLNPRQVFCLRFLHASFLHYARKKIFILSISQEEIFSKNIIHINHPFHPKGWAAVYTAIISASMMIQMWMATAQSICADEIFLLFFGNISPCP